MNKEEIIESLREKAFGLVKEFIDVSTKNNLSALDVAEIVLDVYLQSAIYTFGSIIHAGHQDKEYWDRILLPKILAKMKTHFEETKIYYLSKPFSPKTKQ